MKDQCCTEEQMNILKELGIDVSNTSISFSEIYNLDKDSPTERTFTVADMFAILPESIKDNYKQNNFYFETLKRNGGYACAYSNHYLKETRYSSKKYCELLRDALFDILVQLKKDNLW